MNRELKPKDSLNRPGEVLIDHCRPAPEYSSKQPAAYLDNFNLPVVFNDGN